MARGPTTTFEPGDEPWRCCAKNRQGNRCGQRVVPGRRVCRLHGGASPGGPIKHGRYSKSLGRFKEAYEEAKNDPSLMDLRESLALLDLTVQRAAERATENDTPEFRKSALQLARSVQDSVGTDDFEAQLGDLIELLEKGVREDGALEELARAAERLGRRQEKAWGIRLDAATALNARDLVAVLSRFADIVLEEASKDAARRIVSRIDGEILGSGPAAVGLEAGGEA